MRKKLLFAFIGLGLAISSCSSDNGGDPIETADGCATDVAWLQPGKQVKYQLSQFGFPAGFMSLEFGDCNGTGFVTTRKMFTLDNQVVSESADVVYREGDFVMNDVGSNGGYASKLYKKNAQLGDVWSETNDSGSIITHEVVSMDSTVTVPAGTFNCKVYKYTSSTTINEQFIFWNDEVGEVKESGFVGLELTEYN